MYLTNTLKKGNNMKAKVIATGRVVDVVKTIRKKTIHDYFGSQNDIEIVVYYDGKNQYTESELEFDVSSDPDYWTRLEPIPFKYVLDNIILPRFMPIKRLPSLNYKPRKTTYKTVKRFSAKRNK